LVQSTHANPDKMLPLTSSVFHIMLVLQGKDKHGYGIMRAITEITGGQVKIGPGTFYGSIKRMLEAGLIEESDERPDPDLDDQRRRYYRLTDFGQQVLSAEVARLSKLIHLAESKRLSGSKP
jgi:DNA-binding PadR family transcriptional regulator